MKLIKLPNGDWISPQSIRAIRKLPVAFSPESRTIHEPRFVVDTANGGCIIVECADAAEVEAKADALAAQVSEAIG